MERSEPQLFESFDAKLGAIPVLLLDTDIRDTGIAKPKARSVDKMLADAGLPTPEIAALLGKTDRAVQSQPTARPREGSRDKAKGGAR